MTTWTFTRHSTGDVIDVEAGSRWNDGIRAFADHMKAVFEASRTDGKRLNTIRANDKADGGFELVAVDGAVRSEKFGFTVSWYQPTIRGPVEYDGTQSDWHSGKFHA